jgi:hypothetical protein
MKIKKVGVWIAVATLPLMVMFQNCAKQGVSTEPTSPTFSTISSSADVPPGEDFKFDQAPEAASNPDEVRFQILDPIAERLADIEEAKADCAMALSEQAPEGEVKSATESVKGFRGKVVLAPRDFGGNTSFDTLSDAYGKIYICGLTVNGIANTGGRLVLINSTVVNQIAHAGTIDLIQSEISSLALSRGIIFIHE